METRSGLPGNGRDGAPAALDEDRGFAVFWFNPFPALRTYARYPSQYPSRFDQRRPHRPRQDCAAGGDPGGRVDLGGGAGARHVVPPRLAAGGGDQRVAAGAGGHGSDRRPSGRRRCADAERGAGHSSSIAPSKTSPDPPPRRNSAPWASWCGSGARRAPDSPRRNSARLSYPGHFKMTVKVCGPLLPRVHPIDPSAPSSRPCSTRPSPSG